MNKIYLSRRNLLTLLSKLDRSERGEFTACCIIKNDTTNPRYPTTEQTAIFAISDSAYYFDRVPGEVDQKDEPL